MKKLVLLLMAICCILTACGGQENPAPSEAPSEAPTSAPTVTQTEAPTEAPAANVVSPLPATVNADTLWTDSATFAVSLKEGAFYRGSSGIPQLQVIVYTYDLYDMADIAVLKGGDTIVIRGEHVVIEALEHTQNGAVIINGGLDLGGYELRTDDDTVYYEIGYSDVKSWYEVGDVILPVSGDFVYTDSSDLDNGPVTYSLDDIFSDDSPIDYNFVPQNTIIMIENSEVTAMERIYAP